MNTYRLGAVTALSAFSCLAHSASFAGANDLCFVVSEGKVAFNVTSYDGTHSVTAVGSYTLSGSIYQLALEDSFGNTVSGNFDNAALVLSLKAAKKVRNSPSAVLATYGTFSVKEATCEVIL